MNGRFQQRIFCTVCIFMKILAFFTVISDLFKRAFYISCLDQVLPAKHYFVFTMCHPFIISLPLPPYNLHCG